MIAQTGIDFVLIGMQGKKSGDSSVWTIIVLPINRIRQLRDYTILHDDVVVRLEVFVKKLQSRE